MDNIVGIIPARMASSRFPGKPMADIHGMPMIGHCYLRSRMSKSLSDCWVATPDKEIFEYIESIGGKPLMTSHKHEMCNDRVAEAVTKIEKKSGKKIDIVINIQGDEPLVYPEHIDAIAKTIKDDTSVKCALGYTEYTKKDSPSDIKAVLDLHGNVIYCSRTDLPSDVYVPVDKTKKLCFIVAFRKPFLTQYASWSPTPLEKIELNEYLRILEQGEKIRAVRIDGAKISVDTKEDLISVRKLMESDKIRLSYTPPL